MKNLTKRQSAILYFVIQHKNSGNQHIKEFVENHFGAISRVTVVRELDALLKTGYLKKEGKGRNVTYCQALRNKLLAYFNHQTYFQKGPDERILSFERFNFDIFKNFHDIFSAEEITELTQINDAYRKRIKKLSVNIIQKEIERLTIELSWKSSQIEGNTYSLIDTEILIKEHKQAKGHKEEEAVMILNHKTALDYIFAKKNGFTTLHIRDIETIHALLVKNMGVTQGLRKNIVGITGTRYKPLDNQHQIREAVEKTVAVINKLKDPFSKALTALLCISYVQPFEDGNKRTARLLANAILVAHATCPLSFRSVNESDYKKAVLLFYEQNNISLLKELFVKQFTFAVKNYFQDKA